MAGGDLLGPGLGFRLARLAGDLDLALGRERPDDRVEQVAGAAAMGRGDRVGLLPAEPVELGAFELELLVVGLVDDDDHRRGRTAQDARRLEVGRGHPGHRVDHEQDRVGLGDGQAGLLLDARLDRIVGIELETAGVDDDEAPAVPLGVAVEAVTRGARAVLDDRRAIAEDPVEERALADVRSPDDGDDREPTPGAGHGSGCARRGNLVGGPGRCRKRGRAAGGRGGPVERGVRQLGGLASRSRACRPSRRSARSRRAGPRSASRSRR